MILLELKLRLLVPKLQLQSSKISCESFLVGREMADVFLQVGELLTMVDLFRDERVVVAAMK